tara:strand:+ start:276 stop:515 length:240 start_codon:yes stop_codon:yes gene_type:complete
MITSKKINKMPTQSMVLDDVFAFAEQYKADPMVVSACLMIVAKSIYLNVLGPSQTADMLHLFAEGAENSMYDIKKETLH